jgi:hypothetical protein
MIADNRTFIDRFKGTSLKQMRFNRVKMLEKLVIVQVDEVTSALKLKFLLLVLVNIL